MATYRNQKAFDGTHLVSNVWPGRWLRKPNPRNVGRFAFDSLVEFQSPSLAKAGSNLRTYLPPHTRHLSNTSAKTYTRNTPASPSFLKVHTAAVPPSPSHVPEIPPPPPQTTTHKANSSRSTVLYQYIFPSFINATNQSPSWSSG
ncbi:hypothetical protein M409DRAFT_53986 [Zasmidium cellare ATCC 36951]|uniref:Uncharacterized protein n=1 Tax=Zasmidium cellare ATCC 36951 TaxID=1080233 RepID=A0A6A6CN84_ZASCE|nr:uncharacterized protein M409DRAFT_53986 [Zasmidium cellare ATCC 36951]KAF2167382.1 hypothetical protein M409DRAFT_53986 [Zasmidium cellare ATCC 36951]